MSNWMTSQIVSTLESQEELSKRNMMGDSYVPIHDKKNCMVNLSEVADISENALEFNGEELPATTILYKNGASTTILAPFRQVAQRLKLSE